MVLSPIIFLLTTVCEGRNTLKLFMIWTWFVIWVENSWVLAQVWFMKLLLAEIGSILVLFFSYHGEFWLLLYVHAFEDFFYYLCGQNHYWFFDWWLQAEGLRDCKRYRAPRQFTIVSSCSRDCHHWFDLGFLCSTYKVYIAIIDLWLYKSYRCGSSMWRRRRAHIHTV